MLHEEHQGRCISAPGKGSVKRGYMVVETAVEAGGAACGNIAELYG